MKSTTPNTLSDSQPPNPADVDVIAADLDVAGYSVLKNFWSDQELRRFESTVVALYHAQVLKIAGIRGSFDRGIDPTEYTSVQDLDNLMMVMDEFDPEALYQVLPMILGSGAGRALMSSSRLLTLVSTLLQCPEPLLIGDGPTLFANLPRKKRLLYNWHTEAHYYPKRQNFLNLWFPVFRDKQMDNGTMHVAIGSHRKTYHDFVEYQGFDDESLGKRNHFVQLEVPEEDIGQFETTPIEASRGDLVIFHRNLVHRSDHNMSNAITYTAVSKFFDYRGDLTLSGNKAAVPYGDDRGRPGLTRLRNVSDV